MGQSIVVKTVLLIDIADKHHNCSDFDPKSVGWKTVRRHSIEHLDVSIRTVDNVHVIDLFHVWEIE